MIPAALAIVEGWGGGSAALSPAGWVTVAAASVLVCVAIAAGWRDPW